jgi:2,3-bisphosphoglycerate-dependent phosphoglycerate mutase
MHLYIVRHGESEANAGRFYGGAETLLTARGVEQAHFVAERFNTIPFDAIISSNMVRTVHTAEIINQSFNKSHLITPLISELKKPSELLGVSEDDPEYKRISHEIYQHNFDAQWRYSDEEIFTEVCLRAEEFLDNYIASLSYESAVVVSHGTFMRFLIGYMLFGKDFSAKQGANVRRFLQTKNTGITWCEKDAKGLWRMHTWMDHAHLG